MPYVDSARIAAHSPSAQAGQPNQVARVADRYRALLSQRPGRFHPRWEQSGGGDLEGDRGSVRGADRRGRAPVALHRRLREGAHRGGAKNSTPPQWHRHRGRMGTCVRRYRGLPSGGTRHGLPPRLHHREGKYPHR